MSRKKWSLPLVALMTALFTVAMVGVAWADLATNQSISINGGAADTSSLSATVTVAVKHCPPGGDLKALEVAFRNSTSDAWTVVHAADTNWPGSDADGCTSGDPTSPTTDFAWTLASGGDGSRTVFARFKHAGDEVFAQDDINFTAPPPADITPPLVSYTLTPASPNGSNGWYTSDVVVDWAVTDPDSPITSMTGCDDTTVGTDNTGVSFTCSATSAGGTNSVTTVTIKRDATLPTISGSISPAANGNGWNNSDVTVSYTCNDNLSGVASCGPDETLSNEGTGQSSTGTAVDNAGNSATATVSGINIDTTNPTVSLDGGPTNGASYYFGFVPAPPTCSASDGLSGLDGTCSVSGYGTAVGSHTVTASATDKAGNIASAGASYTVLAWTLNGFYQPVDMNVMNFAKNGSTVPLKFEVFAGSTELTDTAVVDYFTQKINCAEGIGDDIEQYATGGTNLRYDTTGGQFVFNWQTPRQKGACYRVTMQTLDGTKISATFQLK